jgi:DNA-binding transcriptional regulator GbsR (MarR family)
MSIFQSELVNKFILKKHYLAENSNIDNINEVIKDLCGLHSTELKTSYLSLFTRIKNFKKEDLERELYINRNLGRIRGMRRTLFIFTKDMIPIVFTATAKLFEKNLDKYMEFHKISENDYQNISKSIIEILKGQELSASEIRNKLNSQKNIPAIIQILCNNCILIRSKPIKGWKDRRNNYALFTDYFPDINLKRLSEKDAINILIEKYIQSYGPVTIDDISWWTGLTKSEVKNSLKSIETKIKRIKIENNETDYFIFKLAFIDLEKHSLNLLPPLDPYTMGYKERGRYIDSKNYDYLFDRSGNATSSIILDGKVIGVWDTEIKPEPAIKIYLFYGIGKILQKNLYLKAQKMGEFYLESKVLIKECESMVPLSKRTAGGFMTPLKNS